MAGLFLGKDMGRMLGPRSLINIIGLVILVTLIFISEWSRQQPYLGFNVFRDIEGGVRITNVQNPNLITKLKTDAKVIRIESQQGNGFMLRVEDFSTSKIEKRRAFTSKLGELSAKAKIYELLTSSNKNLSLITADGETMHFTLMDTRPISQLGSVFWTRLTLGALAVIMGALVWAWKPQQREHILLLLSGGSLFLMTIPSAIEGIEMFVASEAAFWFLDYLTLISTIIFLTASSLTLVYFPQQLTAASHWRNFILVFFAGFTLVVLVNKWNPDLTLFEQRFYATSGERYAAIVIGYSIILLLCCCQWMASRNKPLERMQSKSVILAWLTGPTILMLFYLIPIAYLKIDPPLSRTWAWGCITLSYLMVLIGIGRVKLFENDKYITAVWQWFFATVLFVTIDLVLVFFLGMDPTISSMFLFVVVLWFYLPLRQWLFRIFVGQDGDFYQMHFSRGINFLTNYSLHKSLSSADVWEQTLRGIYNPISFQWLQNGAEKTQLENIGQALVVRKSEFLPGVAIEFADKGSRLFSQQDVAMADSLVLFYEKLCGFQSAFIAGQQLERKRIGRDLHDQIGHDLLSLIYLANDNQSRRLAQNTMQRLREVIRALDRDSITLDSLANEISNIYLSACPLSSIDPHLEIADSDNTYLFGSAIYLNLLNIFRELLSNTIKHSQATSVWFSLTVNDGKVIFIHQDNGVGFDINGKHDGFGLHNIRERANEINAVVAWNHQGFQLTLTL